MKLSCLIVKISMFIALLFCLCISQTKITKESVSTTLCWVSDPAPDVKYIIVQRGYPTDTGWALAGITDATEFKLLKGSQPDIVIGVRVICGGDTSEIHSSLDSTACSVNGQCGDECTANGPWYLHWKIGKPQRISIRDDDN
jgi:hypothetical protein